MPLLAARLGKSGCDRVRAATVSLPKYKSKSGFENSILSEMQTVSVSSFKVSDILMGIATICGNQQPLNISRIFVLLQCLDYIDTRRVSKVTELGERSSRDYVKACRMAIPHLQKLFKQGCVEQPLPDY